MPIRGIYGLRHTNHLRTGLPLERPFFSTMELLCKLKKIWEQTKDDDAIYNCMEQYLLDHDLFDPLRPEADTKPALFEKAFALFFEERLFTRLDLITVE